MAVREYLQPDALRAITKSGYTRSVWSQKRVHPGIKSKHTPRATRLAKNKLYPCMRENDPGTPVNGYYAWPSTVFGYFFG